MHALDDRVGGEDEVAQMRDIIAQPLRARMERESTQGGEELGFGHRAKVSRCDDRAPLRQRASMTEKRLTDRACCHRDRGRADRFPTSLTPDRKITRLNSSP